MTRKTKMCWENARRDEKVNALFFSCFSKPENLVPPPRRARNVCRARAFDSRSERRPVRETSASVEGAFAPHLPRRRHA